MDNSKKKIAYKIYLVVLLLTFIAGYMCGFAVLAEKYSKMFVYIMLLCIWVLSMLKVIIEGVKAFRKEYIDESFSVVFIALISMLPLILLSSLFGINTVNGNDIGSMSASKLGLTLFSSLIFAPIVEELICRGALWKILKDKIIKDENKIIVISGVIFSTLHIIKMNSGVGNVVFYFMVYMVLGTACGYMYKKTDNILCPWLVHLMWNGFMMVGAVIRMIL